MAKEIERKYLVRHPLPGSDGADMVRHIVQCYLSVDPAMTVRLRVIDGTDARITVKGLTDGAVRDEWEYPIPVSDAQEMMRSLPVVALVDKTRMVFGRWELDIFHGRHEGLAVAEIELTSADEVIELPYFIGREVTGDPRYYNSALGLCSALPPVD